MRVRDGRGYNGSTAGTREPQEVGGYNSIDELVLSLRTPTTLRGDGVRDMTKGKVFPAWGSGTEGV